MGSVGGSVIFIFWVFLGFGRFSGFFWVWKMKGDEGHEEDEEFLENPEKR